MAQIKEQLPLLRQYKANGKSELRDSTAAENKSLPVHRWVPWIAGFSAAFVEDAIETYLPKQRRSRHRVLDPFAGVATTMVEALKAGCNTIGYELNAYAALAARAKVSCVDIRTRDLKTEIDAFRDSMQQFEKDIDRKWGEGGEEGISSLLNPLRSAIPVDFRSRIPFFSPPVEGKFLCAREHISSLQEPLRTLFQAALGATMVSVSNYTYEPSLSTRPGAGKPLIENASLALPVTRKLDEMLEDIAQMEKVYGPRWRPRERLVHCGSYFESKLRANSVSLVVTSPPYMNNYHYVRNTRPQLHWLGLLQRPEEMREYEQKSFGTFWQTVRQAEPVHLNFHFKELSEKIEKLRLVNAARGAYGGPGWANYVARYFNDTKRFLGMLKRHLKPGGNAVIVVGNSIIQGTEFKVDEYLASMADQDGFIVEAVEIVRAKRVGTSIIDSSVRNGGSNSGRTKLYDAAVVLRKS